MHRRLAAAAGAGLRRISHLSHPPHDPKLAFLRDELEGLEPPEPPREPWRGEEARRGGGMEAKMEQVEIAHPWPEWVAFMELLLQRGYLEPTAFARTASSSPPSSLSLSKDANQIRTACLDFARERGELIRYLSRRDIQIVVHCGCPSIDRKIVNSGKRLRAHVGFDEGAVCSQCNLRGGCERAYVKSRKEEIGRTVDVMRIVLTHGLDITTGSVENRACLSKTVKESIKNLLSEIVELGSKEPGSNIEKVRQQMSKDESAVPMKQGDWICPKCKFLNFAKNIKCLRCNGEFQERYQMLHEDQEHLPLKKGDWICKKCNFLNFARNTRCLQCHEKPTDRQLNPGEWECVSCNYINFKRNAFCLRCNWKRPKSLNSQGTFEQLEPHRGDLEQSKHLAISFVQDGVESKKWPLLRRNNPASDEDSDFWSSEEDGGSKSGHDNLDTKKDSTFLDSFPIIGGRSTISQDPLAREKWKEETTRRNKGIPMKEPEESNRRLGPACLPRSMELDESGDEDEIASWFTGARSNRKLS